MPDKHPHADSTAAETGEPAVLRVLLVLTLLSGLIDAVCYLGLGRVFTANMTGNVVVLGFAAAGAPGFSATATLTSLGMFLAGALTGGLISRRMPRRSRRMIVAIGCEAGLVTTAAIVAFLASTGASGWGRYTTIAILAFAMGIRNSVIRSLEIPDMTTTVLTLTLTGLAADSRLVGGDNARAGRRAAAVLAMLAGAIAGAAMFLHNDAALPLGVSAVLAAVLVPAVRNRRAAGFLDRK